MPITKRLFFALLILVVLLLLGSFFAERYDSLRHGLQHSPDPTFKKLGDRTGLDQNEYVNIGWLKIREGRNDSPSFLKYPLRKAAGVVRVGFFGGSMAVCGGSAGGKNFSYPDFLGEKFKKAGINTVEVINFGVGAYGMAQEYMLWKFLGQAYDLDYVIFAIHDFPESRDLSFKADFAPFQPMHARFILEHDQLVFMPVIGLTRDEAYKIYFRLPPPLRYLRYDKAMPLWLKVFLPESLHDRVNPFYYKSRAQSRDEWISISAAILQEISPRAKQIIVLAKEEHVERFRSAVRCLNVHFFVPKISQSLASFPYLSDGVHPNALGNELIAEELFSYLAGKKTWGSSLLEVTPRLGPPKNKASSFTFPLSEYDAMSFRVGQRLVAGLFRYQSREPLNGPPAKFFSDEGKVESFVMLSSRDSKSFGFLPLTFALKDQETVFLSFKKKGHVRRIPCGTVYAPSGIVGEIEGASKDFALNLLDRELIIGDPEIIKEINKGVERINITIADKVILRAQPTKVSVLDSFKGKFSHRRKNLRLSLKEVTFEMVDLKPDQRYFFRGDPFEKELGTVDLVLEKKGGIVETCPIFSYRRIPFRHAIPDTYKDLKV